MRSGRGWRLHHTLKLLMDRQFSALEHSAWGLLASVLLPMISSSLCLRGFRQTKMTLQYFVSAPHGLHDSSAQERAALTARAVRAVWRSGIDHPDCLNASLTLWWLLARKRITSDLRVGVHKDEGKFEAHAWVECGGAPLNEPEPRHQHFRAFDAALALRPPEPQ
jgi:Transglutaminase-like superfamily